MDDNLIIEKLNEFVNNSLESQFLFPSTLTSNQRRRVHETSKLLDLISNTFENDSGKFVSVKKPKLIDTFQPFNRWTVEKANDWYEKLPWLVGCNYIPSYASNQIEMWHNFNVIQIENELTLAKSIGFNVIRVYLHDLLWVHELDFLNRINEFLAICDKQSIFVIFVLWDDCHRPNPAWGVQPLPVKGVHNSNWLQSPGLDIVNSIYDNSISEEKLNQLEDYVKGILNAYKDDNRIIIWDLYNEPGQSGNSDKSNNLLRLTWQWATSVRPSQPLTSCLDGSIGYENYCTNFTYSDIFTFHEYNSSLFEEIILNIRKKSENRPIICTEFMAREFGTTFSFVLPICKKYKIGCICWGLINGKTQTQYNWDTIKLLNELRDQREYLLDEAIVNEPEIWFHDIFRIDGTPYILDEVETIISFTKTT